MEIQTSEKTARIRQLNDLFRNTFTGGKVMPTPEVRNSPCLLGILGAIKSFNAFDGANDPHGEHDFVSVEVGGETWFAKIDYYDRELRGAAADPSDPITTTRVMTIMHASEY